MKTLIARNERETVAAQTDYRRDRRCFSRQLFSMSPEREAALAAQTKRIQAELKRLGRSA
jgi:hypothetical protein